MKVIAESEAPEDLVAQGRITKEKATQSIAHLTSLAPNILSALFNIYSETQPMFRGSLLACIDAYLSISTPKVQQYYYKLSFRN